MVQSEIKEDRQYLNNLTPRVAASVHLPVIVFIHGGGFTQGAGAVAICDGTNLAAKGAVVTINYSLGVFGFLAYPELTSESTHRNFGNHCLLDHIAALQRVRSHHQPVFTYFFARGIPWPAHPEFGALHTGEIPYFFLNLKILDRPWEKIDHALEAGLLPTSSTLRRGVIQMGVV